ncbi:methyltransferase domain-containing protein [Synechococcus sp. CS-205]|nr:methyltransferase domain-containing protein [Synechococcus sp. CS-205]
MNIDMSNVETFAGQVVTDIAAAFSGVMTNIGHKLGLYKAMAGEGWISSQQLAAKTYTDERYVREWLNNQAAGGYVAYDVETRRYNLPDEHVPVLADDDSPLFLVPALEVASSLWMDEGRVIEVFRTGEGIPWSDHHHRLFCGSESLFRPGYKAHLASGWIAALDGVAEKLAAGGKVADVGCGHGASTLVMAEAFPNSTIVGFDSHESSIATARQRAADAKSQGCVRFELASAKGYGEQGFDLICFMDCLHDMGDPVGAARHARQALKDDGTLLLVEPAAGDGVEQNLNPVSRLYYAASTAVCTPCSKSQDVGLALGAQAGEARLSEVLREAGFRSVRRAAETPFNLILEARK